MSSFRSKTVLRLLTAHRVVGEEASGRLVFGTLDQALQKCEELILSEAGREESRYSIYKI